MVQEQKFQMKNFNSIFLSKKKSDANASILEGQLFFSF